MSAYKKLSRPHRHAAGYSRLWLAEDHLLLVTSSGYSEEYRRFFFADIQALFVRKTRLGVAWNWGFGVAAVVFAILGSLVPDAAPLFWLLAFLFAVATGINAALGPTCSVHVQTAIATHPLEPLRRLRSAKKTIASLASFIRGAQGEVTPEQLAVITTTPGAPFAPATVSS